LDFLGLPLSSPLLSSPLLLGLSFSSFLAIATARLTLLQCR
jgi:hypothetical protein